jgi:uncharacterized protein YbbK (DUF523 family)
MSGEGDKRPVIISACLVGAKTRYNGRNAFSFEAMSRVDRERNFIAVCPEVFGGLGVPRPRAEIISGDGVDVLEGRAAVVNENRADVTEAFVRGARETLKMARLVGATKAILKEKSPSCGLNLISRSGEAVAGTGVLAALLRSEGIKIESY